MFFIRTATAVAFVTIFTQSFNIDALTFRSEVHASSTRLAASPVEVTCVFCRLDSILA
jgi:hypothetical protein